MLESSIRVQFLAVGCAVLTALYVVSSPASAQVNVSDTPRSDEMFVEPQGLEQLGRTSGTAAGQVGQRQTLMDTALNAEPLTRLNNRIQNRIDSRLDNRIDSSYDPEERGTSAFEMAGNRARQANRAKPR